MSDPKDPPKPDEKTPPAAPSSDGAEVVPIEEARKRSEERAAQSGDAPPASPGAAVLQPVMAAVLKELAGLAGPDGAIKLGGEDAVARAKTAAVLKGIGAGLGAALAEAFGKWAEKLAQPPQAAPTDKPADPAAPPTATPTTTPTDDKKTDPPKSN